ncbi:GGDEF domain-containing protein, partial [Anaerosolibacter sp.]|uniref:GGDEF domain-containing protein n=1 Tax=Anaerosolibacter sp. TaxID=1872527 RepID=UPI0039F0B418
IILDEDRKVIYGSIGDKDEINTLLEKTHVYDRIKKEDFVMDKWGDFQVIVKKISINNQRLYILELTVDIQANRFLSAAYKDIMSGLYNRNMWEYVTHNKFDGIEGNFNSLIIIDIDDLKEVNDREGHAVGDLHIKIVAESIKQSIREKDIAFRYGGDEFIILLNDLESGDIQKLMNRVREKICEESKNKGIQVSMGGAVFEKFSDLTEAFQKADNLLYIEKQRKKLQEISKKYEELSELKETINEIRRHLNDLIGEKKHHFNDEILDLSKQLDHVIYSCIVGQGDLNSRVLADSEEKL